MTAPTEPIPAADPLLTALGCPPGLAAEVVGLLLARGQTVATAESLTAGLVTAALTTVAGSSAVVRGGLVVYATDLKAALAGVSDDLLAEHGAVHPDVAAALAEGARGRCLADWGLGLTGVAGPGAQDGVAAGRVHIAVAGADRTIGYTLDLPGDRHAVRAGSAVAVIKALRTALIG
jgi:nicotinamide-nucleotide amidase